jgi:hypothetical protein
VGGPARQIRRAENGPNNPDHAQSRQILFCRFAFFRVFSFLLLFVFKGRYSVLPRPAARELAQKKPFPTLGSRNFYLGFCNSSHFPGHCWSLTHLSNAWALRTIYSVVACKLGLECFAGGGFSGVANWLLVADNWAFSAGQLAG